MSSDGHRALTKVMEQHSDLTDRLRALGEPPLPDDLARRHVAAFAAATAGTDLGGRSPRPKRFGRLAVAGAAMVGFVAGSTGLAAAGALPGPAQGVAHDVLNVVGVDVPDSRGRCISQAARTHGDDDAAKQAAKDACPQGGKPAGVGGGKPDGVGGGKPEGVGGGPPQELLEDGDPCKGPPPWAGRGQPTDEERAAHQAGRAGCPSAEAEVEEPQPAAEEPQPAD